MYLNIKKPTVILLFLIVLLLFFTNVIAAETTIEGIRYLVNKGEYGEALKKLENITTADDPDLVFYKAVILSWQKKYLESEEILLKLINKYPERLDFYNHLARIYGWMGDFDKAEKIIKKAQTIDESAERTAVLALHAEWQEEWFKAKKLWEKAYQLSDNKEKQIEYKSNIEKIEEIIKTVYFVESEFEYDEELVTNLLAGGEKLIKDGINFETSAGITYDDEINYLLRSELQFKYPALKKPLELKTYIDFISGGDNEKITYNSDLKYKLKNDDVLALYLEANDFSADDSNELEEKTDYQLLELEYQKKMEKSLISFKNTSRHDESGWTADFSQHLDYYYPLESYLLNFKLSHYKGGEYVFRFGVDISDILLNNNWKLNNFNSWINSEKAAKIDMRFDRR